MGWKSFVKETDPLEGVEGCGWTEIQMLGGDGHHCQGSTVNKQGGHSPWLCDTRCWSRGWADQHRIILGGSINYMHTDHRCYNRKLRGKWITYVRCSEEGNI